MFLIGRWEQPKVAEMWIVRRCDRASELGYKARGRPNVQLNPQQSASALQSEVLLHPTRSTPPLPRSLPLATTATDVVQVEVCQHRLSARISFRSLLPLKQLIKVFLSELGHW